MGAIQDLVPVMNKVWPSYTGNNTYLWSREVRGENMRRGACEKGDSAEEMGNIL